MTAMFKDGDITVIRVENERVDAAAAPALKADFQQQLSDGARKLILDLNAVSFMDSTGLGVLVSLLKMIGSEGSLAVAGPQPAVRRLFELTKLDSLFRLTGSVEEARTLLDG